MESKYYLAPITYLKRVLLEKLRNNQFNHELVTFIESIPEEQLHSFNLEKFEFIKQILKKYKTYTSYYSDLIKMLFHSLDGNFLVSYNYIHCDYIIEQLYELYSTIDFRKAACHFTNIVNEIDEDNADWLCDILSDLYYLTSLTPERINSLGQIAIRRFQSPAIMKDVGIRYMLAGEYRKSMRYFHDYIGKVEQLNIMNEEVVRDYLLTAEVFFKSDNIAMTFVHIRKGLDLADEIYVNDNELRNYAYILLIKGYTKKLGDFSGKQEEFLKQFNRVKNKLNQTIQWENASDEVFNVLNEFEKLVLKQNNVI